MDALAFCSRILAQTTGPSSAVCALRADSAESSPISRLDHAPSPTANFRAPSPEPLLAPLQRPPAVY
jgi:hypothetical protein